MIVRMASRLLFSEHAPDRLLDWDVSEEQVEAVLVDGETIGEYEDEARLVVGWSGGGHEHSMGGGLP